MLAVQCNKKKLEKKFGKKIWKKNLENGECSQWRAIKKPTIHGEKKQCTAVQAQQSGSISNKRTSDLASPFDTLLTLTSFRVEEEEEEEEEDVVVAEEDCNLSLSRLDISSYGSRSSGVRACILRAFRV